jgi:steroid 5-alpha reductase family enzyme/predicted DCC family thiol-disulfide oxidoreductase YuxK
LAPLSNLTAFPYEIFLIAALCLIAHVSAWALVAIYKKMAGLADIAWGLGFFLVAWVSFLLSPFSWNALFVNLMVTFWALRLSAHIFWRNRNRKEDFRYEAMKKAWGPHIKLRLFAQVFLLQGIILYIVALPILWINTHPELVTLDALILAIPFWLTGFLIETVSDLQLYHFQQNPANQGKLLTTGLWGFVRHPNYLGEILQWWVFWALSAKALLVISPLLISFLIIKVSGIAPLEKKMQSHPDFPAYASKTPSLIPVSWMNSGLYTLGWLSIVYFGPRTFFLVPLTFFLITYGLQLFLFYRSDQKSLYLSIPLSLYAILLGILQELIFVQFHLLEYPHVGLLTPLYIFCLYSLFAQTLNSSLGFLNKNLFLGFLVGGFGSFFAYLSAQKLGSVQILFPISYPIIFLCWGLYLTVLLFLNRKLNQLLLRYADPVLLENTLTVFFDENCPVCSAEKKKLEQRIQTGKIIYDCLGSEKEFNKKTDKISYDSAMKKIQALDSKGQIFTGIDALSEIYARTDLLWIALTLQLPGFRLFFTSAYAIWAWLRRRLLKK